MTCCQCQGIERLFDRREALAQADSYTRQGPSQTTRLLLDAVKAADVEDATLLDIGGGVGVAQLELLLAGLRQRHRCRRLLRLSRRRARGSPATWVW